MAAEEIGTRIRKRRQVLGLTQADLAASLGVSKSTVANWESGKHFPLRYAGVIEAALGIEITDGQQPEGPAYAEPELQALYDRLPDYFDDTEKRALVELGRALRAQRQRQQRRAR